MGKHFILCAAILTSGCASLSVPVPSGYTAQANESALIKEAVALQNSYVERAKALNKDSLIINGLGTTAALATLGFGAFDAHKDNLKAAALISGASLVFSNQLTPGQRSKFMAQAADAVGCVVDNARTVDLTAAATTPVPAAGTNALFSLMGLAPGQLGYEELDQLLIQTLVYANLFNPPSGRLKASIEAATAGRARLKTAIQDRSKFPGEMVSALARIRSAVRTQKAPDLNSLLNELAQVKPPQAAPPVPDDPATQSNAKNNILDAQKAAPGAAAPDQDTIASALETLVGLVDTLNPEKETVALNRLKACVAEFAAQ